MHSIILRFLFATAIIVSTAQAQAEEVGDIGVDWTGNDIKIEAMADPDIKGITCHLAYFERGLIDRFSKGNFFEDPSNSSIACRITGPVVIGDIAMGDGGEEVFRQGISLFVKKLAVKRIYDAGNKTIIYLSHSRELTEGSAKMAISTVPLYGADVTWSKGEP
jgi:CreA protein